MTDLNAKIIPLQTETPGLAPTEVQCDVGEIAVNLTDRKIFSKRSDGTVVTLAGGSKIQDAEDFKPNYPDGGQPIGRWVFRGQQTLGSMCSRAGDAVFSSSLIQVATVDADGYDVSAELQEVDASNTTSFWIAVNGVHVQNSSSRSYVEITCRFYMEGNGLTPSLGDEIEIWAVGVEPAELALPLNEGEILRYDGSFWRPSLNTVENLENVAGTAADGHVLQYDGTDWQAQALLFDITEAQDFAFTQALPATPRWTNGDWLEDGEFTRTITQWIFNFVDANGNDRQAFFERWATATSIWSSPDGVAWTEYPFTQLEVKPVTSTCEITFEEPAPAADAPIFIAFSEPGIEINQPIIDGQVMVWDGSHWTPANPTESLALTLNDLTDVNTITNPPADGQALVWDQTNGYWKPGTVASDSGGAETLDELTDVTLSTPLTGQVLTYSGAQWVNAKVNWTDLEDAPNVPQVIDDLGDVDTSTTAPTPGQVLTWDGTSWAPATSTGGGGARETVGGALTERADVTVTTDYTTGGTENIEFTGMGEAGSFVTVTATQPCWVRLYGTDTARTGDALRPIDEDPLAGSGVLLEVRIKNANEIITISPGAIYYNNDVLPEQTLYGRVTNESGGAAAIGVTIRAFTQTHTDAIVGGTFGSG